MQNKQSKRILFLPYTYTLGGGSEKILHTILKSLDKSKYAPFLLECSHFKNFKNDVKGLRLLSPIIDFTRIDFVHYFSKIILILTKYFPVLGKLLVGDVLKNQLPAALQEAFWAESGLTPAIIMEKVYKGPFPNRFLASLSPFLLRHMEEPAIRDLVSNSFRAFFARNVMQYDYWEHPVYLTGSIAWYYQDILKDVAREFELRLGTIVQSPVQGLIHYHCVL